MTDINKIYVLKETISGKYLPAGQIKSDDFIETCLVENLISAQKYYDLESAINTARRRCKQWADRYTWYMKKERSSIKRRDKENIEREERQKKYEAGDISYEEYHNSPTRQYFGPNYWRYNTYPKMKVIDSFFKKGQIKFEVVAFTIKDTPTVLESNHIRRSFFGTKKKRQTIEREKNEQD